MQNLNFQKVACFAPVIGLMIGGILGGLDVGMNYLGIPMLTRNALVVGAWIAITGGLHLDAAMDTADGLAVGDPQRRLQVMMDSATGVFGSISAIMIIVLKITALTDMVLSGSVISVVTPAWFNHKLGGHTGDTYGAVVEWTEALFLCVITTI